MWAASPGHITYRVAGCEDPHGARSRAQILPRTSKEATRAWWRHFPVGHPSVLLAGEDVSSGIGDDVQRPTIRQAFAGEGV